MPIDASGFGVRINLRASETFPSGIDITQFADDTNPIDIPSVQIRDVAMGVNGDMVKWSKGNPIRATIAVIPNSDDDLNLKALAAANRPARGRRAVLDDITIIVIYPDGADVQMLRGTITDAVPSKGVASSGRLQTATYAFAFEDMQ